MSGRLNSGKEDPLKSAGKSGACLGAGRRTNQESMEIILFITTV